MLSATGGGGVFCAVKQEKMINENTSRIGFMK